MAKSGADIEPAMSAALFDLSGTTALVTGSSGGLGLASTAACSAVMLSGPVGRRRAPGAMLPMHKSGASRVMLSAACRLPVIGFGSLFGEFASLFGSLLLVREPLQLLRTTS